MIEWTPILVALIAAGALTYAANIVKWFMAKRRAATPEGRQAANINTVDQSLAVVARARDELEADNDRLRAEIAEKDARYASERDATEARHEADRARWELRDRARREEIEVLERKLRALLAEVEKLKDRHTFDEIEATRSRTTGSQYPGPQGH